MSRRHWSMQRVVRVYLDYINLRYSFAKAPYVLLACGHRKRDPWDVYSNEKAVRMRAGLHYAFTPNATRKCRCYRCPNTGPHP